MLSFIVYNFRMIKVALIVAFVVVVVVVPVVGLCEVGVAQGKIDNPSRM